MTSSKLHRYLRGLDLVELVEINLINPSKFSMRSNLGDLHSLIGSIKSRGLLQPLIVRATDQAFELVAGHRRFEACRRLGFSSIPCMVKELNEREAFELSLMENIQRETLDPVDEARAFKKYVLDHGWGGVTDLAHRVGKSEEYVSHRIMLLNLPKSVLEEISRRRLNASTAYELRILDDREAQEQMAKLAIKHGLTVRKIRQASKLVRDGLAPFEAAQFLARRGRDLEDEREFALHETVLALRMCLMRLDAVVRRVQDNESSKAILDVRFSIHSLIDRCLGTAKESRRATLQQVQLRR